METIRHICNACTRRYGAFELQIVRYLRYKGSALVWRHAFCCNECLQTFVHYHKGKAIITEDEDDIFQ